MLPKEPRGKTTPLFSFTHMSRRTLVFCVLALAAAAIFVRLGFWQLARLNEKQTRNTLLVQHQLQSPMALTALPRDTTLAHYRVASVSGRFDYDHEMILSGRTRRGSPGVEFITPVRIAGSDTAVLVNRGWVYSPDASSVDRARWREADSARVTGYVELYSANAGPNSARDPHVVRRVSRRDIAEKVPYPVAPFYLVSVGDTADLTHPARKDIPVPDDGPHLGYALQWFSFAVIALVGAAVVVRKEERT
jgi:surfeit locus 1 family protein